MKIYLGQSNIASLNTILQRAFNALGHETISANIQDDPIRDPCTIELPKETAKRLGKYRISHPQATAQQLAEEKSRIHDRILDEMFTEAMRSDICIFTGRTFRKDFEDVKRLKENGVKVVFFFCGSESRFLPVDAAYRKKLELPPSPQSLNPVNTLYYLRMAEKHADLILGISASSLRPAYTAVSMTEVDDAGLAVPDNDIPQIIHAPSNRNNKGTDIWLRIFSELEDEGHKFDVHIVENLPHKQLLKLLKSMDIHCGSLVIGGALDREAVAAGCVSLSVASTFTKYGVARATKDMEILMERFSVQPGSQEHEYVRDRFRLNAWYHIPEENPLVAVTPQTAKARLRTFLQNRELRRVKAHAGREKLEKYCSPHRVARDILDYLANPGSFRAEAMLGWQYSFLNREYSPQSEEERALVPLVNSTTRFVWECPWYEEYVLPLERDGLIF